MGRDRARVRLLTASLAAASNPWQHSARHRREPHGRGGDDAYCAGVPAGRRLCGARRAGRGPRCGWWTSPRRPVCPGRRSTTSSAARTAWPAPWCGGRPTAISHGRRARPPAGRRGDADPASGCAAAAEWTVRGGPEKPLVRAVLTGCWSERLPSPAARPPPRRAGPVPARGGPLRSTRGGLRGAPVVPRRCGARPARAAAPAAAPRRPCAGAVVRWCRPGRTDPAQLAAVADRAAAEDGGAVIRAVLAVSAARRSARGQLPVAGRRSP